MKFSKYGVPVSVEGAPRSRCSIKATAFLPHSADKRPVAYCENMQGQRRWLCQGCLESLRAERWAQRFGLEELGEGALAALRHVLFAPQGFTPPVEVNRRTASIWHALRDLERRKLIMRHLRVDASQAVRLRFAARDACPSCLQRGSHAEDCGLSFGEAFAERKRG